MAPACGICGRPMRQYGDEWKCMTSPADHKKILDANAKGHADQQRKSKRGKGFRGRRKKR